VPGLTTALLARCERIVEVDRPQRPARRGGVKSDDIDAVRAARQALAGVGLSEPRRRGDREAIRVLLATRALVVTFRTRAIASGHTLVTVSAANNGSGRARGLKCDGSMASTTLARVWPSEPGPVCRIDHPAAAPRHPGR
jgi:transposase